MPIVIVTANASKADVTQALKLRVNDYVLKPFTAELLKARIAAVCASVGGDSADDGTAGSLADASTGPALAPS